MPSLVHPARRPPWEDDDIAAYTTTAPLCRAHHGPSFGPMLEARGLERSDRRGEVAASIKVDDHAYRDEDPCTVQDLLRLASDAGEAAQWLAEVQSAPGS